MSGFDCVKFGDYCIGYHRKNLPGAMVPVRWGLPPSKPWKAGRRQPICPMFCPTPDQVVCFAVPLDQTHIDAWFNKQNHENHLKDNIRANVIASGISL